MSSVYVLEPPTKGKVLLKTTAGPLDFELWPKEAPKAVRNFVQLCLDGYYDGTIFHRIIKTFMVQGGDPTGTGTGGDTIYGEPFADEFHSRLRFNHRGLVACANAGSPNSNNSQFFISLDRCDWLDKKHTIFGKVTGDTVYNLIKLGEVETGSDDRPVDPAPKIISVEVLWNPFDDVVPRQVARKGIEAVAVDDAAPKNRKKAKKELNLLSFGEEAEEEEQQLASVKEKKIKSSHDVLHDPRLLKSDNDASKMDPMEAQRRQELQNSTRKALKESVKKADESSAQRFSRARSPGSDEDDEANFDKRMREQIMEKKKLMHMGGAKSGGRDSNKRGKTSTSTSKPDPAPRSGTDDESEDDSDDDGTVKKEKLSIKTKGLGSQARAELAETADKDMELMSPLEQQRMKYKQKKKSLLGREESTLARLERFTNVLAKTKTKPKETSSSVTDAVKDEEDKANADWLAHSLKFEVDPTKKGDMDRNEDPNQYVVHDPLLEKGKEKFNKMQAKMKRRDRQWAGKSVT
ncbi:unnamed protein product [Calypogeia fissa]